ncbi:MAG TPA: hypothetical protein VNO43_07440 [Candidatus Eisenbacteria bacterium]|nr:hypothetical protein [Candidatus Eisenbacteria bacterium]
MTPAGPAQKRREEEIERLATQTGRLIREADPETREQLVESASAIIREESRAPRETTPTATAVERPMNPLAAGLGLLIVGAGLAFLMPFLGVALIAIGIIASVWGLAISWWRK